MGEPAAEAVRGHEEGVHHLLEPRAKGGKALVTPYGAANFATGGHGKLTMLPWRAFKECVHRCRSVLVDEFKSTVVHARDGSVMKQVWSRHKKAAF